jgi:hypothetical protein
MFERFTDRARRVVVLAQEEARLLNHNYIGTEHILLGLIHEGEGVAAKALESLGIKLEAVRQQVEQTIGRGKDAPSGHIPFTPRQVLVRLGAPFDRVRQQVIKLVRELPEGEPGPGRLRGWERSEILNTLRAINDRLTAIEGHLGLSKPGQAKPGEPAAQPEQPAQDDEPPAGQDDHGEAAG